MQIVQRYAIRNLSTQMYYEEMTRMWSSISDATVYSSEIQAFEAIQLLQSDIFGGNSIVPAVTIETIFYPI